MPEEGQHVPKMLQEASSKLPEEKRKVLETIAMEYTVSDDLRLIMTFVAGLSKRNRKLIEITIEKLNEIG